MVRRKSSRVTEVDFSHKKKSRMETEDETSSTEEEEFNNSESSRSESSEPSVSHTKKKKKKWSQSEEYHMCSLWKENVCLYDSDHKHYHDYEKRNFALESIASAVNRTVKEVKKRMTTLRTIFGKAIQLPDNKELSKRQSDVISLCMFLKPFMKPRSAKSKRHSKEKSKSKLAVQTVNGAQKDRNVTSPNPAGVIIVTADVHSSSVPPADEHSSSSVPPLTAPNQREQTIPSSSTATSEVNLPVSQSDDILQVLPSTSHETTDPPPSNLFTTKFQSGDKEKTVVVNETEDVEQEEVGDSTYETGSTENLPPFLKQYLEMVSRNQTMTFNTHEWWARLLAEKLKLIPAKKAEELKVEIDTMILKFLPDNF